MNWKGTKAFGWHKNHASHQKSSIGACYCRERFDGNMPFVLLMVVVVCRSWREMTKGTANMMYGICSYYGPKQSSFTLVIFVPLQISFNELYTYKGCVCVYVLCPINGEHLFLLSPIVLWKESEGRQNNNKKWVPIMNTFFHSYHEEISTSFLAILLICAYVGVQFCL